jgi:predicted ATPase with chaperone activity
MIRVTRTIADLDAADALIVAHLSEATQYRRLDRKPFA